MPTFSELLLTLEDRHGLPPGLLSAVAKTESNLNPRAVSPKGAKGLFQFMDPTARQYGVDPFNPVSSAIGAARMLGDLNRQFGGNVPLALASYNWGIGNVKNKGMSRAPKETRGYIDKILRAISPVGMAYAEEPMGEPSRIPTREEFMRMRQEEAQATEQEAIPTREEFMAMKQANQVPQAPLADDETGVMDLIKNAGLGFAARGNQAMAALNPWADRERIAAEQQWVKENTGAGLGQAAADMMIQAPMNVVMPGAGVAGVAARAVGSGLVEGATRPGTLREKAGEAALGASGSVAGDTLGSALKMLNTPFKKLNTEAQKKIVAMADRLGIPMSAANRTGNKALQVMDSVLDTMPTSASMQAGSKGAQKEAWTRMVFEQGGENANIASPEVMGAMKDRLSATYTDIASRNVINIDNQLIRDLDQVRIDQLKRVPTNQKGVVKSYLDDILRKIPRNRQAQISALTYQDMRSMLDKQARALERSDPITSGALRSIRSAMDDAMQRSVSPEDFSALMQTNKEWGVMRSIERAADPLTGEISPKKFISELTKRNSNGMLYGRGDQTLNDLARIGKELIGEKIGESGTGPRTFMQNILKSPITMMGAGGAGMAAGGIPGAVAGVAGSALLPMGVSKMMWSPRGYLSEGMIDLSKEIIPGLTREGAFDIMSRGAGIGLSRKVTEKPEKRR